jgi:glutamine amidotransferase
MLCVIPPYATPSREKLENSALNNPDGFGFAIVIPSENRIHVERTMNADTSINRFLEMRAKYPEGHATWHARYATHGLVNVDNCHPFEVGSSQTYLAHNGVLSLDIPQGDTRSDTRVFAEDFLAKIGGASALDNPQVYNVVEEFTAGSKIVVLTLDPRASQQMYLFHAEKGTWDRDGVWWSNDTCYLSTYSYGKYSSKYYTYDDAAYGNYYTQGEENYYIGTPAVLDKKYDIYTCTVCQSTMSYEQIEEASWVCDLCKTCQMCEFDIVACLCYRPKGSSAQYEDLTEVPEALLERVKQSAGRYEASFNFVSHKWELLDTYVDTYPDSNVVALPKPDHKNNAWSLS